MMDKNYLLLENQLCFPIYAVSRMITRAYQPYLEKLNLTYPQYLVMLVLWEKSPKSVSEIGELLYLNSNTLTPILKKLTNKGFVEKQRSQEDERKVFISIIKKGEELKILAEKIPLQMVDDINIPIETIEEMKNSMWNFLKEIKK